MRKAQVKLVKKSVWAPAHTLPAGLPVEKRMAEGKSVRNRVPRVSHGRWQPSPRRPDPIKILLESNIGRLPELLPIRYGRMMQSPFAFYRGAAAIMASDLAPTPTTGFQVQVCGDCHLLNFGGFATPERRMVFGINDFDETLPGPWEWDLKRLVTSFVVASRFNHYKPAETRECALACTRSYRKHMAKFTEFKTLELWYARIDLDMILKTLNSKDAKQRLQKRMDKVASRNVLEDDFPQLAEAKAGRFRIKDHPPLIFHPPDSQEKDFNDKIDQAYLRYRETLSEDRRLLLDRFERQDVALKVVGIGSVGTWCGIMLMMAEERDPLFLQIKEARRSVMEPYLGASSFPNHGQRVVIGQKLIQAASDIFLGWTTGRKGRHFYVRQLRDMKLKPLIETFTPELMRLFAKICGWSLAKAHARSGDPARISGYLGSKPVIDEAMADFAESYADQNERDHQALLKAVGSGQISVSLER